MVQPAALPRPEHPRPDFRREAWINLNGPWRFAFDPRDVGEQLRWYRVGSGERADQAAPGAVAVEDPFGGEILVPFPWQSRLSGVGDTAYKGAAWYQRTLDVPADWAERDAAEDAPTAAGLPSAGDTHAARPTPREAVAWRLRPFLCFGAVDWNAKVWIDGHFVAEHDGGYSPFSVDLARHVRPGQRCTLTVRAYDTCAADTPIGKQTERWYTPSGGIWQTVWLEGRPAAYLRQAHVRTDPATGVAAFALAIEAPEAGGAYRLTVASPEGAFPPVEQPLALQPGGNQAEVEVRVPRPRAWSPDDPYLYDCTITLAPEAGGQADAVATYFGLRSVARGRWEDRPDEFVLLNGEPIYLRGALDQAFTPDGLHTYPSDDAIRADVQAARDLGLNMLRCHIKVNEPRYYYWADRLGVLIMYDLPSASIYTPRARANWERTFRDAVARDCSHPSIIAWVLFNETWGLEEHRTPTSWAWVSDMYDLAKRLDATRLVEDNSACLYDHVKTDLNSWHFYIDDYDRARRHVERVVAQTYEASPFNYVGGVHWHLAGAADYKQGTAPLLNSEYAGLGARGGDKDISASFKFLTTELRRHEKIRGYVYTELTDVEWEHNGLLNYDRSAKGFGYEHFVPGMTVADLNGADFVGLDCPPCPTLSPGAEFRAAAFVSHWDRRPLEGAVLRWEATVIDRFGERRRLDEGRRPLCLRRYAVTEAGEAAIRLPGAPGLVTLALWLEDGRGNIRARNYANVDVFDVAAPSYRPVERTGRGYALRFRPGDFRDASWPEPRIAPGGTKFQGRGIGWVEYAVALPEDLDPATVRGLRLRLEVAGGMARTRIGWRDQAHILTTDYPQTEETQAPTDLAVAINGVDLGRVRLPDDPADATGVLSLAVDKSWDFASYGYLTTLEADAETARRILASGDGSLLVRLATPPDGIRGGLSLYGARSGAYPVDPTIFIDQE